MDNFQEYSLFYLNDPYDEFSNRGDKSKDKKYGRKAARRTQRKNIRDYLDEYYDEFSYKLEPLLPSEEDYYLDLYDDTDEWNYEKSLTWDID